MFKVGNMVIGNKKAARYSITKPGWTEQVTKIYNTEFMEVEGEGMFGNMCSFDVLIDAFDLYDVKSASEHELLSLLPA